MGYIDFHCHLDSEEFKKDRKQIVDNIFNSGISKIISVADPYEDGSHQATKEIMEYNSNIFSMTAAHPHNADNYTDEIEKRVLEFSEKERSIGVGEAGLDYYYDLSSRDNQKRVFRRQISIAKELDLPLVIHSRNAEEDVLEILEKEKFNNPVVFHCYTGNASDAAKIIERGYHLSFSGIITFKKSDELRRVVSSIPLDRIFSETDSPYLSPEPFRGKTNSPEKVVIVANKIAEIKSINIEELNSKILMNFRTVFKK